MNNVMVETKKNPNIFIQLLWFFFVGIWLGQAWMIAAWIMMVTIIGIPLGVMMLNNLPKVIALREPSRKVLISTGTNGQMAKKEVQQDQLPFLLRAIYFLLVGWWFSALWMEAAYGISLTIIGLPVGFWMFDRVPAVLSLHR